MRQAVRWFLLETRLGDWLLAGFEALTGLVVVDQGDVVVASCAADI